MTSYYTLRCHPDTRATAVRSVSIEVTMIGENGVRLAFYLSPAESLKLPAAAPSRRTHELWRHTCFEMFLKVEGEEGYSEFNLSPSSEWAAYGFTGYRLGMHDLALPVNPHIECERQGEAFVLDADVDLPAIAGSRLLTGFSAVIEETNGTKSYWALAHPPGKPDFHHETCFAAELPAPRTS
jgi:hypothetical protein